MTGIDVLRISECIEAGLPCRVRQSQGKFGAVLADAGSDMPNFEEIRPGVCRLEPAFNKVWPNIGQDWPMFGQVWTDVHKLPRILATFGPSLGKLHSKLADIGPSRVKYGKRAG